MHSVVTKMVADLPPAVLTDWEVTWNRGSDTLHIVYPDPQSPFCKVTFTHAGKAQDYGHASFDRIEALAKALAAQS
jgi:hypothetical protein